MFKKILIANRGEIACRIIRTAHKLGTKTVAIYSDADTYAKHTIQADEAWNIGPSQVNQSYLNADKIIDIAKKTNADAIHPGYGFLSENAQFAEKIEKTHITFIGPNAQTIQLMGLKDHARKLMKKHNIPVIPGYDGEKQETPYLEKKAREIGFPILIKARAGGGGKGMRIVRQPKHFQQALESAQREAKANFEDPTCMIEKYIEKARHIEVQICADTHGNIVHLFERDCSIQRRYQKIIEEAPAPNITPEMQQKICQTAVKIAQIINYTGAGTIEFICDTTNGLKTDQFYFMEMNTRLQVEHPITEEITGEDLVEWQIKIACGQKLPKNQSQLKINGCAIEARLYAENPEKGFLPASGYIREIFLADKHARIESAIRKNDSISPFYDPMIAKIITHEKTRQEAVNALNQTLEQSYIIGTETNLNFLRTIGKHEIFLNAKADTAWIEREDQTYTQKYPNEIIALAAVTAIRSNQQKNNPHTDNDLQYQDPWQTLSGFSNSEPMAQTIQLQYQETHYICAVITHNQNNFTVTIEQHHFQIHINDTHNTYQYCQINAQTETFKTIRNNHHITLIIRNTPYTFRLINTAEQKKQDGSDQNQLLSPMPGTVKKLNAKKGQYVKKGDPLIVLEAMKMEHTLTAPKNGTIKNIYVQEGQQSEAGIIVLDIDDEK